MPLSSFRPPDVAVRIIKRENGGSGVVFTLIRAASKTWRRLNGTNWFTLGSVGA